MRDANIFSTRILKNMVKKIEKIDCYFDFALLLVSVPTNSAKNEQFGSPKRGREVTLQARKIMTEQKFFVDNFFVQDINFSCIRSQIANLRKWNCACRSWGNKQ